MKDLTKIFLSPSDRENIIKAVKDAEKETAGEIVPMIVPVSYHYPVADIVGGAAFGLPLALAATYLVGGWLWIGTQNLWLFLGLFGLLFIVFQQTIKRSTRLKRLFVSENEMLEEVEEAAFVNFYKNGLNRTRDETGILLFISVFEKKVCILADRGIDQKVPADQWNQTVETIVAGIKQNRQGEAICEAISEVGRLLALHFPVKPDDVDELDNLVVQE